MAIRKRKGWQSGAHKRKQVLLDEAHEGQFEEWAEAAKRLGMTKGRAELIRTAVTEYLRRHLKL